MSNPDDELEGGMIGSTPAHLAKWGGASDTMKGQPDDDMRKAIEEFVVDIMHLQLDAVYGNDRDRLTVNREQEFQDYLATRTAQNEIDHIKIELDKPSTTSKILDDPDKYLRQVESDVLAQLKERVLQAIGENPPESEWWRYSGELLGDIRTRSTIRAAIEEVFKEEK